MKDQEAIRKKIRENEDFIYCPRLSNSLEQLISKNPEGVLDERILKVLMITQEELDEIYGSAIEKLGKAVRDNQ